VARAQYVEGSSFGRPKLSAQQATEPWRHCERTRRMAARLDVIVMQPVSRQELPFRIAGVFSSAMPRFSHFAELTQ